MDAVIPPARRVASTPAPGFDGHYRLGQFWPASGRVVLGDAFSADQWAVLAADPRLRIAPAADGPAQPEPGDLADLIRAAIGRLAPDGFDAKGQPKVAAVRAALPEVPKGVTTALVASVWADLKADVRSGA